MPSLLSLTYSYQSVNDQNQFKLLPLQLGLQTDEGTTIHSLKVYENLQFNQRPKDENVMAKLYIPMYNIAGLPTSMKEKFQNKNHENGRHKIINELREENSAGFQAQNSFALSDFMMRFLKLQD